MLLLGCWVGSQTLVSLSLRLKDFLGPVTRVKKKKKKLLGAFCVEVHAFAKARILIAHTSGGSFKLGRREVCLAWREKGDSGLQNGGY